MVRKLKAFNYDLNVIIILDYLKKTVHNLFTVTTNIQGGSCERSPLKLFNKILENYLRKS